jgi:AcrR family transcriptional regulator
VVDTRPKRRAARSRPSLDRDGIVDAALRIVATPGVDVLSFRKLGIELGADHTAIYRHFADRDALMRAIIDRLLDEVCDSIDLDDPWDARLRTSALATLRLARRYPAVGIELAQHTTAGPGERRSIELELVAWEEGGLAPAQVVRFYAVFSAYTLSASAAVAAHVLTGSHVGKPDDQSWIGALDDLDPVAHTRIVAYRESLVLLGVDDTYTDGVDLILDAARSEVAAGATRRPPFPRPVRRPAR